MSMADSHHRLICILPPVHTDVAYMYITCEFNELVENSGLGQEINGGVNETVLNCYPNGC